MVRSGKVRGWMMDVANKHDISIDTVFEFYMSLIPNRNIGTLRERTESFFDLYFKEVKEGNNG